MFSGQYLAGANQHARSCATTGINEDDMVFRVFFIVKKKIAEIYPGISRKTLFTAGSSRTCLTW
tara:strand:- start:481 stop:672 length:192 start_codon:yes stop_codon:yes gene_type:complete